MHQTGSLGQISTDIMSGKNMAHCATTPAASNCCESKPDDPRRGSSRRYRPWESLLGSILTVPHRLAAVALRLPRRSKLSYLRKHSLAHGNRQISTHLGHQKCRNHQLLPLRNSFLAHLPLLPHQKLRRNENPRQGRKTNQMTTSRFQMHIVQP